jgi:hypothetical protein
VNLEMFDNFRPDSWQECGILKATARFVRGHWSGLRRSEKWRTSASVLGGAVLVLAIAGGASLFDTASTGNAGAIRNAVISRTEPQFATDTLRYEVSPKLWGSLMTYIDTWPDLPPEEAVLESEPFV